MSDAAIWYCTRQRAGPLVKECRALRPRLSQEDTREDHRAKQEILRYSHSAVWPTELFTLFDRDVKAHCQHLLSVLRRVGSTF